MAGLAASFPGFDFLNAAFTPDQQRELQAFAARLQGWLDAQHKQDGSHGAVTADSAAVTGDITANGNITADNDGDPSALGTFTTTASGFAALRGLRVKYGASTSDWRVGAGGGLRREYLFEDLLGITAQGYTFRFYYDTANYVLERDSGVTMYLGSSGTPMTAVYGQTIAPTQKVVVGTALANAQITSNQNNYNPTGFLTSPTSFINSDAARDITGFAAGATGQRIRLMNNGSFTITLKYNSASSTLGNRIIATGGVDYAIASLASVDIEYQAGSWWVIR